MTYIIILIVLLISKKISSIIRLMILLWYTNSDKLLLWSRLTGSLKYNKLFSNIRLYHLDVTVGQTLK